MLCPHLKHLPLLPPPLQKPPERLPSMTMPPLFLQRQLGKGPPQGREVEQRIISEPACASRSRQQLAVRLAGERRDRLPVACQRDDGNVFACKFPISRAF